MKTFVAVVALLILGGLALAHHIAGMQDEIDKKKIEEDET